MVVGGVKVRTVENWHPGVLRRCRSNDRGRNKPHPRTAQLLLCWQAERKKEKSTIWQSPTGAVFRTNLVQQFTYKRENRNNISAWSVLLKEGGKQIPEVGLTGHSKRFLQHCPVSVLSKPSTHMNTVSHFDIILSQCRLTEYRTSIPLLETAIIKINMFFRPHVQFLLMP